MARPAAGAVGGEDGVEQSRAAGGQVRRGRGEDRRLAGTRREEGGEAAQLAFIGGAGFEPGDAGAAGVDPRFEPASGVDECAQELGTPPGESAGRRKRVGQRDVGAQAVRRLGRTRCGAGGVAGDEEARPRVHLDRRRFVLERSRSRKAHRRGGFIARAFGAGELAAVAADGKPGFAARGDEERQHRFGAQRHVGGAVGNRQRGVLEVTPPSIGFTQQISGGRNRLGAGTGPIRAEADRDQRAQGAARVAVSGERGDAAGLGQWLRREPPGRAFDLALDHVPRASDERASIWEPSDPHRRGAANRGEEFREFGIDMPARPVFDQEPASAGRAVRGEARIADVFAGCAGEGD